MALSLAFQLSEWENAWTVIKYKNRIKWIENRWRDLCVMTALALFYFIYFLINVTVKTSTVGQGEVTEGDISSQPCLVVSMRSCCPDSCCLDNSDEECVDCNFFFHYIYLCKAPFSFYGLFDSNLRHWLKWLFLLLVLNHSFFINFFNEVETTR